MQPSNSQDPTNLIPAAHLPQAAAAVAQNAKNNPDMLQMLQAMQRQINSLMGVQEEQNLADVVLVNPGGRVVEVSGKQAVEYLSKAGFRKATPEEETNYRRAMIRQTPEYLRRLEKKRLIEEKQLLDEIDAEDAADSVSIDSLLRAPVTDAQKTGAPEPKAIADALAQAQTASNTQNTTSNTTTSTSTEDGSPKPPSRKDKAAAKNDTTTSTTNEQTKA